MKAGDGKASARGRPGPWAVPAIAWTTAKEALRQPICLLLGVSFATAILLLPLVLNYTLGDAARIVRDSACSLTFLGALLLGITVATGSVARDFGRGTASLVLTKAVPRGAYVVGKALGAAMPVLLFAAIAATATLLSIRMAGDGSHADWVVATPALLAIPAALLVAGAWNYATGRAVSATALVTLLVLLAATACWAAAMPDLWAQRFPANLDLGVLTAALLLVFPALMAVALGTGLALVVRPGPAFILTLAPFLLGIVTDPLLAGKTGLAARGLYAIIPNVQAFWLLDAASVATPAGIPPAYLFPAAAYACCWSLGVLALAILVFRGRELAA